MNWFDAERIVQEHHLDAWRMAADADVLAYKYPGHSAPRRLAVWLGALLVRCGCRLQGSEAALATVQSLHDGRVRTA